jgi:hypothetical protein
MWENLETVCRKEGSCGVLVLNFARREMLKEITE